MNPANNVMRFCRSEKGEKIWNGIVVSVFLINFFFDIFYMYILKFVYDILGPDEHFFIISPQTFIFVLDLAFVLVCMCRKHYIKKPVYMLAVCYVVLYCICRIAYGEGTYIPGWSDKELMSLVLMVLCISFPFVSITDSCKKRKNFDLVILIVMVTFGLLSLTAVITTIFGGGKTVMIFGTLPFGICDMEPFSILGQFRYYTTYISLIGAIIALYFIAKKKYIILDAILIPVFLFTFSSTKCRSALVALFVSLVFISTIFFRCKYKNKSFVKCIPYVLISCVISGILIVALWWLGGWINKTLVPEFADSVYMQRGFAERFWDGSGRFKKIFECLKIYKNDMPKSLFFGIGIKKAVLEDTEYLIHCGYMKILLLTGIPGLCLLLIYLIKTIKASAAALFKPYGIGDDFSDYVLYTIPICVMIALLFEDFFRFDLANISSVIIIAMFLSSGFMFEHYRQAKNNVLNDKGA